MMAPLTFHSFFMGKTTLLHTLTLSAFHGTATGTVDLNGYPLDQVTFNQHCYYVEQHDTHWPYLTCQETLRCAAELYQRTPVVNNTAVSIDHIVEDVIRKMGLEVCKDTRNARLSGGQRKRLSIGIALLKAPSVLYLDEPTSVRVYGYHVYRYISIWI
jgi:ABC-type multidrug transport system ATPase subunit